jgi:hypothetical protein
VTPAPLDALRVAKVVARTYGAKGLLRRGRYEIRRRWLPTRAVPDQGLPLIDFDFKHRVETGRLIDWASEDLAHIRARAVATASVIVGGSVALFGGQHSDIGWPPAWSTNPVTGAVLPTGASQRIPIGSEVEDVKDPWELARFGWAGSLLRAHAFTGESQWAEAWWTAVESFAAANAVGRGLAWANGQEIALRGIALLLGIATLADDPASTDGRLALVGGLLRDSTHLVAKNLSYALSQRNNHAVSEAAFLWSAAVLCPDLRGAERLGDQGYRAMRECVQDQFGADGSYAQHSFTYQRLALHGLLWARWAAGQSGGALPPNLDDAVAASADLLRSLLDERSGWLPNLGSNDGALLFRLSDSHIRDFRPLVSHAHLAIGLAAPLERGPWDEEAVWFGAKMTEGAPTNRPRQTDSTAYHAFRGGRSHALLRAGPLRHRPSQADQLNVDVWIDGTNVLRDPGTFRYSANSPWQNALSSDEVHNVPSVARRPQARRRGRFFWLDWPEPEIVLTTSTELGEVVIADLAMRGGGATTARRLVARCHDLYITADVVVGDDWQLRWNLPPSTKVRQDDERVSVGGQQFRGTIDTPRNSVRVLTATEDDPTSGWESVTYGEKSALVSVVAALHSGEMALTQIMPASESPLVGDRVDAWRDAARHPSEESARRALRLAGAPHGEDAE